NNVRAKLEAGPVFVELANADFGLIAGDGSVGFELTNGTFSADIAGLAGIGADDVFVQYTNATTTVEAGYEISVGGVSYTFGDGIEADTVAFAVTGFRANVADFVSLSGDLGFRK